MLCIASGSLRVAFLFTLQLYGQASKALGSEEKSRTHMSIHIWTYIQVHILAQNTYI